MPATVDAPGAASPPRRPALRPSWPRRWPWSRRRADGDRVVIGSGADTLAWLHADASGRVRRCGLLERGTDAPEDFLRRLRALGLPAHGACAVLALDEAQLLQIDTPAVRPEEMKSAVRWRIKDLVDARLEELTLDVLHVGGGQTHGHASQLWVVAARSALIRDLARRAQAAGLALGVIDIAETAQRNLQTAAAEAAGLADRATAALCRHGDRALLTLCAGGELFYARRLDWDDAGLALDAPPPTPYAFDNLDFVDYGVADGSGPASGDVGAPRLVVELQRSFDVWERSWPDLPVTALWVQAGDAEEALMGPLSGVLPFPVHRLAPEPLFPGLADAAPSPALRAAVLPLLGVLHRTAAPA